MNILVVEDHDSLRESIVEALCVHGHHAAGIDCAEAISDPDTWVQLDLVVLDLNLPGEDGLSLARRLRQSQPQMGIIMLTARSQGTDRTQGYASGADIYLTKPASASELLSAISALTRRLRPTEGHPHTEAVVLDLRHRSLFRPDDEPVDLTAHEAQLLAAFVRAPQQQLETWQIADILGMDLDRPNKPAIELHMVRLRKKLPASTVARSPILAIRGRGYQLCTDIVLR